MDWHGSRDLGERGRYWDYFVDYLADQCQGVC